MITNWLHFLYGTGFTGGEYALFVFLTFFLMVLLSLPVILSVALFFWAKSRTQ